MKTSIDNIKEIAEQLGCGFRAFIHKTTGELLFVPDEDDLLDMDEWEKELKFLETNFTDYHEIQKWTSNQAFEIMTDFAENLTENKQLQSRLFDALNMKKSFREFRFVIDNSDDFRQQWFDFKNKRERDFVEHQLNRLK